MHVAAEPIVGAAPRTLDWALREETREDEPLLLEIYRQNRNAGEPDFARFSAQQQTDLIVFERAIQRQAIAAVFPSATAFVIIVCGRCVGELVIARSETALHLIEIALARELQCRGIGGELLRHVCDQAAATGVPVELRVAVSNRRARAFYARHGFVETDEDPCYVDMAWSAR